ncbi:MAG: hemolysin family protein [Anaerolineales bacterium]
MIEPVVGLTLLLLLLIAEAVLAAARSALVNSRPANLQRLVEEGAAGSAVAGRIVADSSSLILSLRMALAIIRLLTIGVATAIYLGVTSGLLGFILTLAATGLVMSVVEFLAESLAMREPEAWALDLGPVVAVLEVVLSPPVRLMLKMRGEVSADHNGPLHPLVTEAEIMTLVDAGEEGGFIEQDEKDMIYSIFRLDDTLAREVMIPRIDIQALEESTPIPEATDMLLKTGYSRAPVFRESIDNVIGLIYVKDLLDAWRVGNYERPIGELMREAFFVPEAKKVDDLLEEMQDSRFHLAIVVDEYGGTAGLVTIEDIVEEIVGEIRDEYDFAEEASYQQVEDGEYIFSGGIDLDDVNQIADADLPKDAGETLGGFIYSELGRVPSPGDKLESGGLELVVDQVVRRRIHRVRARRIAPSSDAPDGRDKNGATNGS